MFAEIENCMKLALGKRKNLRFMDLAREYVQAYNLPSSYLVSLQTYAALRNAIDHNSHRGAYPIAEPIPEIVEESASYGTRLRRHQKLSPSYRRWMYARFTPVNP
jgi:hypothetical protein